MPTSTTQNYEKIIEAEGAGKEPMNWYTNLWLAMPIKPLWDIFAMGWKRTCSCCTEEYKTTSNCDKFFFVVSRVIGKNDLKLTFQY